MTRDDRSAQSGAIAGYCFLFGCGLILLIKLLAQLFGLFRHYAPIAREWLIALSVQASGFLDGWGIA